MFVAMKGDIVRTLSSIVTENDVIWLSTKVCSTCVYSCLILIHICLAHLACYGIQNVPSGDWFCQPCELKVKSAVSYCCFEELFVLVLIVSGLEM